MLFEVGLGDAYGSGFENANEVFTIKNNLLVYVQHPRHKNKLGVYSDDAQMSIAIAEAMLDDDEPWSKISLADRFLEVFKRDPRRGYTTYFLNVLLNCESGIELLSKINGKSTKSGAVMRAGPLGFYPDFETVVRKARLQASVTHDSWLGKNSAVGAAMMVHYFYYGLGSKDNLCSWMRDLYFGDTIHSSEPFDTDGEVVECWRPDSNRRVRVHAWDCLEAAIHAIESHDSMSEILKQCVAYMGDVDTVAAIAMGPASCSKEIEQDLPSELVDNLENRGYGRDFLKDLDQKLFAKFPKPENHIHEPEFIDLDEGEVPEVINLSEKSAQEESGDAQWEAI